MRWRWIGRGGDALAITSATEQERAAAERSARQLCRVNADGATTGRRLLHALETGRLEWDVLVSLARWCHTEGRFALGVAPARTVSQAIFNGGIVPRLATFGNERINKPAALRRFRSFAADWDIWATPSDPGGDVSAADAASVSHEEAETGAPVRSVPTTPPVEAPPFAASAAVTTEAVSTDHLPVFGPSGAEIHTLEEWFRLAPPAGGARQWREGRSALELARRWLAAPFPPEIEALLASSPVFAGFQGQRGYAECLTELDEFCGNSRNHDLVVPGVAGSTPLVLDIEAKADESFSTTIAEAVLLAEEALRKNPGSRALERIRRLSRAVFGAEAEAIGELRYQLLYGVAAALIRGRAEGAAAVAFIVHEFRSRETDPRKLTRNQADLEAFVERLGGRPEALAAGLAGPFFVRGNDRITAELPLYLGKAVCCLDGHLEDDETTASGETVAIRSRTAVAGDAASPAGDPRRSVLDGVDALIDAQLRPACGSLAGTAPYYRHRSNFLRLEPELLDGAALVRGLFEQILENIQRWARPQGGSSANWRWEKRLRISPNNSRPEKVLEKRIAAETGADWVNQVSTASGVVSSGERHRNLDLVHRREAGAYEFIELKVNSDMPLMAALEILCYGMIYLASRDEQERLGYSPANALLSARRVDQVVLAPVAYYRGVPPARLAAFAARLDAGLRTLLSGRGDLRDLEMSFRFEAFPDHCAEGPPAELLAARKALTADV